MTIGMTGMRPASFQAMASEKGTTSISTAVAVKIPHLALMMKNRTSGPSSSANFNPRGIFFFAGLVSGFVRRPRLAS